MEITDIQLTKKGRYALFCGDDFLFSIDEEMLLRHEIFIGCELDGQKLAKLRDESELSKAKARALSIIGVRSHSKRELYDKLHQDYDEYTANYCVEELTKYGYLDDDCFADECVEMFTRKKMSIGKARQYLKQKGIDQDIIDRVLDSYSDGEEERIRAVVEKSYLSMLENDPKKVVSKLYTKGFSLDSIKNSLEKMIADND